jgi:predicted MFS family arabinose efflux permease
LEKRAGVISIFMAVGAISLVIGTPITLYLSGIGGWRLTHLIICPSSASAGYSNVFHSYSIRTRSQPK